MEVGEESWKVGFWIGRKDGTRSRREGGRGELERGDMS